MNAETDCDTVEQAGALLVFGGQWECQGDIRGAACSKA